MTLPAPIQGLLDKVSNIPGFERGVTTAKDLIYAGIRTSMAFFMASLLLPAVEKLGITLTPEQLVSINTFGFMVFVALINIVIGLLERYVHPIFGVLLLIPKAPAYGQVMTQTPPPVQPALGEPDVDRGGVDVPVPPEEYQGQHEKD